MANSTKSARIKLATLVVDVLLRAEESIKKKDWEDRIIVLELDKNTEKCMAMCANLEGLSNETGNKPLNKWIQDNVQWGNKSELAYVIDARW